MSVSLVREAETIEAHRLPLKMNGRHTERCVRCSPSMVLSGELFCCQHSAALVAQGLRTVAQVGMPSAGATLSEL